MYYVTESMVKAAVFCHRQ